jgi:hypothetical protein
MEMGGVFHQIVPSHGTASSRTSKRFSMMQSFRDSWKALAAVTSHVLLPTYVNEANCSF